MLRACSLVRLRRGGARSSPPPFLTSRAACSDKGLVWILGRPPRLFLAVGVPLKIHTRPKGLVCPWRGTHASFLFKIWSGVPPQDSNQTQCLALAGIQVRSPHQCEPGSQGVNQADKSSEIDTISDNNTEVDQRVVVKS
ncbi:hypothetical protein AB205_0185900 [Aquarana catesbeiana]|uniref:Uncharacterized protein n=1 Tax=Aquarana catesbeiana TaxID=8400 RepID=A0A2G9RVC9_AQUCT|nr:hypothetical protein AB205_0185900 [Aquarana catesbeiana]